MQGQKTPQQQVHNTLQHQPRTRNSLQCNTTITVIQITYMHLFLHHEKKHDLYKNQTETTAQHLGRGNDNYRNMTRFYSTSVQWVSDWCTVHQYCQTFVPSKVCAKVGLAFWQFLIQAILSELQHFRHFFTDRVYIVVQLVFTHAHWLIQGPDFCSERRIIFLLAGLGYMSRLFTLGLCRIIHR